MILGGQWHVYVSLYPYHGIWTEFQLLVTPMIMKRLLNYLSSLRKHEHAL